MAAAGLQALRPRSKPVRQPSVIHTEHRDDRPHPDFCLHLGGAVFKPLLGARARPPPKGGTCTVTHEEGYETAEKKRLRDLKREASRMD